MKTFTSARAGRPEACPAVRWSARGRSYERQLSLGEAPCLPVGLVEVVEVARGRPLHGGERLLDRLGDPEEREPAGQKRGDGDLVRGVERARVRAAGLARGAREREQRERLEVGCAELQG